jgi:hypothetical protein
MSPLSAAVHPSGSWFPTDDCQHFVQVLAESDARSDHDNAVSSTEPSWLGIAGPIRSFGHSSAPRRCGCCCSPDVATVRSSHPSRRFLDAGSWSALLAMRCLHGRWRPIRRGESPPIPSRFVQTVRVNEPRSTANSRRTFNGGIGEVAGRFAGRRAGMRCGSSCHVHPRPCASRARTLPGMWTATLSACCWSNHCYALRGGIPAGKSPRAS